MIAVKTKFKANELPDSLSDIFHSIERSIPVSAGGYNKTLTKGAETRCVHLAEKATKEGTELFKTDKKWMDQMGSLGSGNHFIELSLDQEDTLWVVLHSGSRGIGNKLAMKHIKVAQKLMEGFFIDLKDKDLAFLPEETTQFNEYIRDLLWAQEFARLNREEMMDRVMKDLSFWIYKEDGHQSEIEVDRVNCHHNFTQREHHMNRDVWITRKGAIQTRQDQRGIIPGSMGTRSYIVKGKGNKLAFDSAPHGAGRRFSRTEANKRFTMDDFDKAMQGVVHRRTEKLIDELPGAYKDIDEVMENAKELVDIEYQLKQIVNIKGD
jgi:tRNA-splicing ligase RtcB